MTVESFILAGGRSTRFGSDKALAALGPSSLLQRALAVLQELGQLPHIVASDPSAYKQLWDRCLTGERPGEGPAEGLRAALAACTRPWALVLAVDMPGVTAEALQILLDGAPPGEEDLAGPGPAGPRAVCFRDEGGRCHPFPGLYHRALGPEIPELGPGASVHAVLERARPRCIGSSELPRPERLGRWLANVNTAEDLERFLRGA